MPNPLNLSAGQQNALAELAVLMASVRYAHSKDTTATQEHTETLDEIADRWDQLNWGELYDKLHRTGANA